MCSTSSTGHQPWKYTHLICTNPSIQTEQSKNAVPSPYLKHTHGFMAFYGIFYGILATRIDHHQLSVPCDLEKINKRMKGKKARKQTRDALHLCKALLLPISCLLILLHPPFFCTFVALTALTGKGSQESGIVITVKSQLL